MTETIEPMHRCTIKFDNNEDKYPGIFIGCRNEKYLVYVLHLDKTMVVDEMFEYEPARMKEKITVVGYDLLESPAYFRYGTTLCLKWGAHSYQVDNGKTMKIIDKEQIDKITCTILT